MSIADSSEKHWLSRLGDFDRLLAEGPTLKNTVDAMRALTTCSAMMLVTLYFYNEIRPEIEFVAVKILLILFAIWIAFYAVIALAQLVLLAALGMMYATIEAAVLVGKKTMPKEKLAQILQSPKTTGYGAKVFAYLAFWLFVCLFFALAQSVSRELNHRFPPLQKANPVQAE